MLLGRRRDGPADNPYRRGGIDREDRVGQGIGHARQFFRGGAAPVGRGEGREFVIELRFMAHARRARPSHQSTQNLFGQPPADLLGLQFLEGVAVLLFPVGGFGHGVFLGSVTTAGRLAGPWRPGIILLINLD